MHGPVGRRSRVVSYPRTAEGEFISLTPMRYGEVIDKSKEWDLKAPFIAGHELFASDDLTENDLMIRQINCSKIVHRLLTQRLSPQQ